MVSAATAAIFLTLGFIGIKLMPGSHWVFKGFLLALSGAAVAFSGGWVGRTLASVSTAGTASTSTVTEGAFGVAVPAVLGIAAAVPYFWALWPKHRVTRTTKGIAGGTMAMVAAVMGPTWAANINGPVGGLIRCGYTQTHTISFGIVGAGFGTGSINGAFGQPCINTPGTVRPQQPGPAGPQAEGGR
jgi:hypothetical protein